MATNHETPAKQIALSVVAEVAPNELPIFDDIWEESAADEHEGTLGDQEMGFGGDASSLLLSTLIIPLVVELLGHQVDRGLDAVVERLRKRRRKLSAENDPRLDEAKIREIAEAVEREIRKGT